MRSKGHQPSFGRLQQESNNDQVICCCLRTGLGVIGAGHAPGTPPTAGRDCHSSPRSLRTWYAPHCEWCLHQNSRPTCRRQVRSWSDLLTSRGTRARGVDQASFLVADDGLSARRSRPYTLQYFAAIRAASTFGRRNLKTRLSKKVIGVGSAVRSSPTRVVLWLHQPQGR